MVPFGRNTSVFGTTYGTKWLLFLVTALFMAFGDRPQRVAGLPAPAGLPAGRSRTSGVEAYRPAVDPHRRLLLGAARADRAHLRAHRGEHLADLAAVRQPVPFHQQDPQFHLDISFFVFDYPFIRMVLSYLFAAVLLSLAGAVLVHALYGGLRLQAPGRAPPPAPRRSCSCWSGHLRRCSRRVAYWVDRYGIDFSQRGMVQTGASYTDVNAVLPAKTVLAVIAVICALLFFAGAVRRSALLPAVGFGLLVLSAVIIGGVYPAIIQQFVVKPNELVKETQYISREIVSTRRAYGVAGVQVIPYPALATRCRPASCWPRRRPRAGLRLMDPAVLSQTFQQLQQVKGYYQFADVLSVDRYLLAGGSQAPQDTVVGVRDMGGPPPGPGQLDQHAPGLHARLRVRRRQGGARRQPTATRSSSRATYRPRGQLGPIQPRVYFGQQENQLRHRRRAASRRNSTTRTRAPAASRTTPTRQAAACRSAPPLNRLLYAVKFRELNILLSGAIDANSKILYTGSRWPGWPRSRRS